jgi:hypothetical protein
MNNTRLKIWFFVTFSLAVIAIVIRSIWQITSIPTAGTMLIFIPLILALIGADVLFAYLLIRPEKLKSGWFATGVTVVLTAGLLAGVTHFVRFIISPRADPVLSKIISAFVLSSSVSAYSIIIFIVWALRRKC